MKLFSLLKSGLLACLFMTVFAQFDAISANHCDSHYKPKCAYKKKSPKYLENKVRSFVEMQEKNNGAFFIKDGKRVRELSLKDIKAQKDGKKKIALGTFSDSNGDSVVVQFAMPKKCKKSSCEKKYNKKKRKWKKEKKKNQACQSCDSKKSKKGKHLSYKIVEVNGEARSNN